MNLLPIIGTVTAVAALAGCSSPPPIVQDKELGYMSRQEVTAAIEECEGAGHRANVVYAKAQWRDKLVPVPVDVQCVPGTRLVRR